MKIISTHGDGSPHRTWTYVNRIPGQPWMGLIPSGATVMEADGGTWQRPYPVCTFFWPDRYYQVFMMIMDSGTDYYCNIIVPPVYDAELEAFTFVDLDLDVVVRNGTIKVLDEDEFAERKSGYPKAWVSGAEEGLALLYDMALHHKGPFSPATEAKWRAWARQR